MKIALVSLAIMTAVVLLAAIAFLFIVNWAAVASDPDSTVRSPKNPKKVAPRDETAAVSRK